MHKRLVHVILTCLLLSIAVIPPVGAARPVVPAQVQVLVVGGTTAGIAAAVAAARAGMTTLLVEPREQIGGDMTLSWLNMLDLNRGPSGQLLTRGIFADVYRTLGQTFDISLAQSTLDALVRAQPTLTVARRLRIGAPVLRGRTLTGVQFVTDDGVRHVVNARLIIDATDDAAVAAASRVPFTIGREESGMDRRMQSATLIYRLAGVSYRAVTRYVLTSEKPRGVGGVSDRYVWGYGDIVSHYRARNPRLAVFDLNLGWQTDGIVLINSLHIYDVDGTSPRSLTAGRAAAVAELPRIVEFLRARAPGFENARLVGAAPHLYVRETRHTTGLYRMTGRDILDGRDFWDRIAVASYPIDLHPYEPGQMNPYAAIRRVYAIPFRILVPRSVDRLMVVGKAVGASYTAAGSLRIIPTGMAMGEAAGEAAALAVRAGVSPVRLAGNRELIAQLQERLTAMGAYLPSPALLSEESHPQRTALRNSP